MKKSDADDRLAHVIHDLRAKVGDRMTAHILYNKALDITRQADHAALAEVEAEQNDR